MVDMVAEHVEAMNREGLSIKGPVDEFTTAIRAVTPNEISGIFKRVLLCVKGQDTAAAIDMLKPHLADDGYVVSVQNDLNENLIAEMIGEDRTVGAFINFGADYHGPGDILFGARSTVVVGELGVKSHRDCRHFTKNCKHSSQTPSPPTMSGGSSGASSRTALSCGPMR